MCVCVWVWVCARAWEASLGDALTGGVALPSDSFIALPRRAGSVHEQLGQALPANH